VADILRMQYRSWDDYKRDVVPELFGNDRFRSGRYLFRGCGSAEWALKSSFDRMFEHLPTRRRLETWTSLLATFRAECEEHGLSASVLADDRRLLAFGQHHGLPTRLLDWSLSPYVAAFFAFRQALTRHGSDQHVAVWVLDTSSPIWSTEMGVEVVAPPAIENLRLLNQAGRFTYARTQHVTLEEYVAAADADSAPLIQIALPAAEALRALPDLHAMGVNAAHLFPDVAGLAEAVSLRVQYDAFADVVTLP
jgi:hypothetical protein